MSSVYAWYNTSSSEDEDDTRDMRLKRRIIRDTSNPLELPNSLFLSYFRLSKDAFKFLLHKVEGKLNLPVGSNSVLPIIKLSAVLRFFAEGNYQKGIGNDWNVGLAQSTFSKVLTELLNVLEEEICSDFIRFPQSTAEKEEVKLGFFTKYGFPGVIGCVDGTHVKLISPSKTEQHLYYNRKGFYSMNVMLICDHNQRITYVDANNPGSSHDSFIWNSSEVDRKLQENFENGDSTSWLLGDAGYPLKPYLMTPFRSSSNNTDQETRFNTMHSRARIVVERTIGLYKGIFRCVLGARELHYKPKKCSQIINVCCALHNVRLHFRVQTSEDQLVETGEESETDVETDIINHNESEAARRIRNRIMMLFANDLFRFLKV